MERGEQGGVDADRPGQKAGGVADGLVQPLLVPGGRFVRAASLKGQDGDENGHSCRAAQGVSVGDRVVTG
ncbi:hypothetical protein [Streptomyces cinereoruber]